MLLFHLASYKGTGKLSSLSLTAFAGANDSRRMRSDRIAQLTCELMVLLEIAAHALDS